MYETRTSSCYKIAVGQRKAWGYDAFFTQEYPVTEQGLKDAKIKIAMLKSRGSQWEGLVLTVIEQTLTEKDLPPDYNFPHYRPDPRD